MSCAVAGVASLLGESYNTTLKLFNKNSASTRGYYCKEIVDALGKRNLIYSYGKVINKTRKHLRIPGTIVFIQRSKKYPAGHFLLKTERGWMDPWINFPDDNPRKSGFRKRLPGKAQWVLYRKPLKQDS